jgi:hypothetical protein
LVKLNNQWKGKMMMLRMKVLWPLCLGSFFATAAMSQHGGPMGDPAHQADRAVYQYLLSQGPSIERRVTFTESGVETLTESAVPEVAAKIKEHVHAMKGRVEDVRPIRMRDPLFAAIFENAEAISMKVEETERGVRVTESSEHPYVVKLIQEHAKVVSNFVKYGHQEAMKNHAVPAP